jgi:hypothetical protein
MAYSKVGIFNMALNHLGITAPIAANSFDKDSRAIILNNFYETARDEVLKAFDWGFANTFKDLTLTTDTSPDPRLPYVYDCPNDCISARAVIDTVKGEEKKFVVHANTLGEKTLLADIECARLRYTKRVEKEDLFEPEFVMALTYYLAALTGETITGQQKRADSCMQKYEYKLVKAKQFNAQEGAADDEDNSQYYDVR